MISVIIFQNADIVLMKFRKCVSLNDRLNCKARDAVLRKLQTSFIVIKIFIYIKDQNT